ncbi:hypothetical protein HIM_05587 [Hirsutella minnesotensis 3608]|uniref:Uncharacterized protein n=1 Tax=Hirsutella minnesotensis 3608 TaxID=1043627 RepID=A0A0F7ZKA7_9HYPO|nr:hypothetical protein HIM_05587 [Hirsutella minnesotensis 3608]
MTSKSARVLAISLHNQPWFDEMYAPLLTALRSKAEFQRAENSTLTFLLGSGSSVCPPRRHGNHHGPVPSFVQPDSVKSFFSRAGLPWGVGSYHRTTFALNQSAVGVDNAQKLPQRYTQKAVFVNNVAPEDMWYNTEDDSVPPTSGKVAGETAVALAKVGEGKLGYVGDVNAEDGSNAVVLAMCGLL